MRLTTYFLSILLILTLGMGTNFCKVEESVIPQTKQETQDSQVFFNSQSIEFLWKNRASSILFEHIKNNETYYILGFDQDGPEIPTDHIPPSGIFSIKKMKNIENMGDETGKNDKPLSFYKIEVTRDVIPFLQFEKESCHVIVRGKRAPPPIRDNQSLGVVYGEKGYVRIEPTTAQDYNAFVKLDKRKFLIHFSKRIDHGLQKHDSELIKTCYSNQGFALLLKSDRLFFSRSNESIIGRLLNQPALDGFQTFIHQAVVTADDSLFSVADEKVNWDAYSDYIHDLISQTPEQKSISLQLELTWIELCRGRGVDAIEQLRYISTIMPQVKSYDKYKLFLGLGYLLNDQYDLALEQFKPLTQTPEILLFSLICKGYIDAKTLDIDTNILQLLPSYPEALRSKLLIKILKLVDHFGTYDLLDTLVNNQEMRPVSKDQAAYFDFYRALYLISQKDKSQAVSLFKNLTNEDPQNTTPNEVRALAGYEIFKANVSQMTPDEALNKLSQLRLLSRGTDIEIRIVLNMADRYVQQNKFNEALKLISDTILTFPQLSMSYFLGNKLRQIYTQFFASDLSKTPPLLIIGLYQKYHKIVPLEREQEIIIINIVAEMLEKVDLLKDAAELLTRSLSIIKSQWKKNLLYLKIAKLYIKALDPDSALAVLDEFRMVPDDQSEEYTLLKAQALIQKKQYSKAQKALAEKETQNTLLLDATIAMEYTHNFKRAEIKLKKLLFTIDQDEKYPPQKKEEIILSYVSVLLMNRNNKEIIKVWNKYKDFMKKGKLYDLFVLFTNQDWQFSSEAEIKEFIENSDAPILGVMKRRESIASFEELLNPGL